MVIGGIDHQEAASDVRRRRTIEQIDSSRRQNVVTVDSSTIGSRNVAPAAPTPLQACEKQKVKNVKKGQVNSRFNYCNHWPLQFVYYNSRGGKIGSISAKAVLVGFGYMGSRRVDLRLQIKDIVKRGNTSYAPDPDLYFQVYCFPTLGQIGGCDDRTNSHLTVRRKMSQWRKTPIADFSLASKPNVGVGVAKVNVAGWQFIGGSNRVNQHTRIINQSVRFDSAQYNTRAKRGGVFWEVMPHLLYRTDDKNVNETASHIWVACNQPWNTHPKIKQSKVIPGCSANFPLHRLVNKTRQKSNRGKARRVCQNVWPNYSARGLDCDEFPFASTYEGAAQCLHEKTKPCNMFSAKAIDKNDNQEAGRRLGRWYDLDRILDWRWKSSRGVEIREVFVIWIRPKR
ncbi:deoxyribonuclease NucA/NucB [Thermomonospora umbrina]|uniref:Deoxyribonuclease NucA/NucB n=2 Tax=Thermomonospora umbrina TaxID=111806 RepID=A0A3D9SX90_9ACTN|nr:deoxyribonuclease NucA/NucB [Thermomonospora umbrina]